MIKSSGFFETSSVAGALRRANMLRIMRFKVQVFRLNWYGRQSWYVIYS